MLQLRVHVYIILVPKKKLELKSYGFTSRLKFEIFATKKPINLSKTLVNNLKLLKVGEINVQQQHNDILEALLNCQNRYRFRSRSKFEIFVNSRNQNLGRNQTSILRRNQKVSEGTKQVLSCCFDQYHFSRFTSRFVGTIELDYFDPHIFTSINFAHQRNQTSIPRRNQISTLRGNE